MAVKDLGTKLSCQSCDAKFYDLKKKTPVCPKCDTEYVAAKPRARRAAAKAAPEPAKEAPKSETPANDDTAKTEDEALLDIEVEVEDDDDSLIEDASDIGEDEDDMAGVIDNIGPAADNKDT